MVETLDETGRELGRDVINGVTGRYGSLPDRQLNLIELEFGIRNTCKMQDSEQVKHERNHITEKPTEYVHKLFLLLKRTIWTIYLITNLLFTMVTTRSANKRKLEALEAASLPLASEPSQKRSKGKHVQEQRSYAVTPHSEHDFQPVSTRLRSAARKTQVDEWHGKQKTQAVPHLPHSFKTMSSAVSTPSRSTSSKERTSANASTCSNSAGNTRDTVHGWKRQRFTSI
jgi:hypothetical protein